MKFLYFKLIVCINLWEKDCLLILLVIICNEKFNWNIKDCSYCLMFWGFICILSEWGFKINLNFLFMLSGMFCFGSCKCSFCRRYLRNINSCVLVRVVLG